VAILVDQAIWRWRGRRWAHLVSDHSYDELHDFAASLGVDRVRFQGDHYDVPSELRERALELGAEAVDCRELVRRLRAAGLRRGPAARQHRELPAQVGPGPGVEQATGDGRAVEHGAGDEVREHGRPA